MSENHTPPNIDSRRTRNRRADIKSGGSGIISVRASPLAIVLASGDARTDIIQIYYSDATGNDMTGAIERFSRLCDRRPEICCM
ncbi:hypothetical protein QUA41_11980 [Microcoleus sp. Pol11C1]|uniref:hypothetical protein n=1 Tax=unclassified Microcoleus TaxID=2642155 RepID=UPI002FD3F1D6